MNAQNVEGCKVIGHSTKPKPLTWKQSFLWLALAVACFHAAYTSIHVPAAGLMIVGYALALTQLPNQPNVRRAFYFGLATGFLCYAPQLWFFFKIFNVAAIVLWLLLAFWVGLFTAIVCGSIRRWGLHRAVWLIPVVWTGLEYFRSELYYLKFSWLNIGYALPPIFSFLGAGMYGCGFVIFAMVTVLLYYRTSLITFLSTKMSPVERILLAIVIFVLFLVLLPGFASAKSRPRVSLSLVGVQLEFPQAAVLPKMLNLAFAQHTNADIFVLSEYTLDGPVPEPLKAWCRAHSRVLVVGGKDPVGTNHYCNTAFVVGTNGEIVFQQGKCVPIQFFNDGLPARSQKVWDSPWGRIGFCVCYDLSYTRVTDELVGQGAQLLIVPTMDVEDWSRHEHELHTRVAPVRAAEYGIPIFRLASSGISQAVAANSEVIAEAPMPGTGNFLVAKLWLPSHASLPRDRWLAPLCTGITAAVTALLLFLTWRNRQPSSPNVARVRPEALHAGNPAEH
jgi:apolipoprotein N-acyltransferase